MNWSHGYNISQGYTYGVYKELSPHWLDLLASHQGIADLPAQGRRYLELGCGQGVGLCALAAMHPNISFTGIDFAPAHIAHARDLAGKIGLQNVEFLEGDFLALAKNWPETLGKFHYVVAHGIYSWIAPMVRDGFIRCLDHATHPLARVYVSYNALPGWYATFPFQHVLRNVQLEHNLDPVEALRVGQGLMHQLQKANAGIFKAYPVLAERLDAVANQDTTYLQQEYLHDNWSPQWHSSVARTLGAVKLTYIGSATLVDNFAQEILGDRLASVRSAAKSGAFLEDLIDCFVNRGFRRDVFVRGAAPNWMRQRTRNLMDQKFVAYRDLDEGTFTIPSAFGEIGVSAALYETVYRTLLGGPVAVADLLSLPPAGRKLEEMLRTLFMLLSNDRCSVALEVDEPRYIQQFNEVMIDSVMNGAPYQYLISPKYGCLESCSTMEMVMLSALKQQPDIGGDALMQHTRQALYRLGKGFGKAGVVLEPGSPQEAEEAANYLERFATRRAPVFRRLGLL